MMWFFIFSGLIACTGKLVGATCPIVMNPPVVVVRYGDDFSVNCTSLTNQTEGMGWESSAGGTDLVKNVTDVSLYIKSVVVWNLSPMCYVNQIDGSQCLQHLPVTVYKTMDSVSLSQPSETGPMVEGKKYRMQCDIANVAPARNLTVYWHKGNEILYTETFDESSLVPVNKSSILDLTVDRNDNGIKIWCEAELKVSQAGLKLPSVLSKSREVTVLYPPTFIKPENETVEVTPQNQLILNCAATGNPMPVYSWQYPQPSQQTNNNQNENQPILAPSFYLPGTYSCTASNIQGTRTKYFNVIEAPANRTAFAAIVAVFGILGALLLIAGPFFVMPSGTFSCNKGSYHPTPSGPV